MPRKTEGSRSTYGAKGDAEPFARSSSSTRPRRAPFWQRARASVSFSRRCPTASDASACLLPLPRAAAHSERARCTHARTHSSAGIWAKRLRRDGATARSSYVSWHAAGMEMSTSPSAAARAATRPQPEPPSRPSRLEIRCGGDAGIRVALSVQGARSSACGGRTTPPVSAPAACSQRRSGSVAASMTPPGGPAGVDAEVAAAATYRRGRASPSPPRGGRRGAARTPARANDARTPPAAAACCNACTPLRARCIACARVARGRGRARVHATAGLQQGAERAMKVRTGPLFWAGTNGA